MLDRRGPIKRGRDRSQNRSEWVGGVICRPRTQGIGQGGESSSQPPVEPGGRVLRITGRRVPWPTPRQPSRLNQSPVPLTSVLAPMDIVGLVGALLVTALTNGRQLHLAEPRRRP